MGSVCNENRPMIVFGIIAVLFGVYACYSASFQLYSACVRRYLKRNRVVPEVTQSQTERIFTTSISWLEAHNDALWCKCFQRITLRLHRSTIQQIRLVCCELGSYKTLFKNQVGSAVGLSAGAGMCVGLLFALTGNVVWTVIAIATGYFLGPFVLVGILKKRREEIQQAVMTELPYMIDAIALGAGAGMSFDQSLETYVKAHDTALALEFRRGVSIWQSGIQTRSAVFDQIEARVKSEPLTRFIRASQQSLQLGTSLVYLLETQADEARRMRKSYLETKIAKTPIKMLLPLASCILPSMLLLLLGPVVLDVMTGLGNQI